MLASKRKTACANRIAKSPHEAYYDGPCAVGTHTRLAFRYAFDCLQDHAWIIVSREPSATRRAVDAENHLNWD